MIGALLLMQTAQTSPPPALSFTYPEEAASFGTLNAPSDAVIVLGGEPWLLRPNEQDASWIFDGTMRRLPKGPAHVWLKCRVTAAGHMADCSAPAETPVGHRLGRAAVKLAPRYRVRVRSPEGQRVIGRSIYILIRLIQPEYGPVGCTAEMVGPC